MATDATCPKHKEVTKEKVTFRSTLLVITNLTKNNKIKFLSGRELPAFLDPCTPFQLRNTFKGKKDSPKKDLVSSERRAARVISVDNMVKIYKIQKISVKDNR